MQDFCTFVEEQSVEALEIPKVRLVYYNDAFLRARKRLISFSDSSKKSLGAGRKDKSPPTSLEVVAEREAEELAKEEMQEEEEEHEAPEIRKSKWIARGKAKVIHPRNPKKDLVKLDEVPRKKRKLLDESNAAAVTVDLPQLPKPMEVQPAPPSEPAELIPPIKYEKRVIIWNEKIVINPCVTQYC